MNRPVQPDTALLRYRGPVTLSWFPHANTNHVALAQGPLGPPCVLKFRRDDTSPPCAEERALRSLRTQGVAVPAVLGRDVVTFVSGVTRECLVMQHVSGARPRNAQDFAALGAALGRMLKAVPPLGLPIRDDSTVYKQHVQRLQYLQGALGGATVVPAVAEAGPGSRGFAHGDPGPDNCLVLTDQSVVLLDFEQAHVGPMQLDAARVCVAVSLATSAGEADAAVAAVLRGLHAEDIPTPTAWWFSIALVAIARWRLKRCEAYAREALQHWTLLVERTRTC